MGTRACVFRAPTPSYPMRMRLPPKRERCPTAAGGGGNVQLVQPVSGPLSLLSLIIRLPPPPSPPPPSFFLLPDCADGARVTPLMTDADGAAAGEMPPCRRLQQPLGPPHPPPPQQPVGPGSPRTSPSTCTREERVGIGKVRGVGSTGYPGERSPRCHQNASCWAN